ncbi:MAG: alanine dehydrogenase [Dehalococcoidia bacterium]|nr:alanine dehydrogenase [Chloroflexi bacterium CFX7]MCK6565895.1 alanine dehydrogenase [Dehalococcoidia bacterium]NUQ56371.1 alanine dehydrogenase [Dehalococcoidia bacterium]RIL03795.1 MAG: alanine dehydrogenase [bacterium]
MRAGTVRERIDGESRVGITPEGAFVLTTAGHEVLVEAGAGEPAGYPDDSYRAAGARIVADAAGVWEGCDLVVKVKEPVASEHPFLRPGCALFTFLHLAADRALTERLLESRCPSLAYELVRRPDGTLPLLAPMSQVAGRMAAEVGAQLLKHPGPGRGKLLGGIAGVPPGRAVIIGSGTVGTAAAHVLSALGARVTIMSRDLPRLGYLQELFGGLVATRVSTPDAVADEVAGADLAILGVLVPGAPAPKVLSRAMVRSMGPGAVIVDVSIDQGGAAETSRHTTHSNPIYVEEGVVHYCVSNIPGAVPRTSTQALTSATLPYVEAIANRGLEAALREDSALARSLSTWNGTLVRGPVAEAFGLPAAPNPFL